MGELNPLKLENQICFPIYACAREITKAYTPYLAKIDLTYTQYITMMVMWEENVISFKDLGKKLFLDSGTLTPVIKNLEKKGLVTKTRSNVDERNVDVSITEKGIALKEQAKEIPQKMLCAYNLPKEDIMQLYTLTHNILDHISNN